MEFASKCFTRIVVTLQIAIYIRSHNNFDDINHVSRMFAKQQYSSTRIRNLGVTLLFS